MMKRVLTTVVLSWLLVSASGCCSGKFFHCFGRAIFGPWVCGTDHRGGHGRGDCHGQCGYGHGGYGHGGYGHGNDCCDCGPGHCHRGCGGLYCDDAYCTGGCRGGCDAWYNVGCNPCCNSYGCGDIYLTDLFHPICDPCGWWHGRRGRRHHDGDCCPGECQPYGHHHVGHAACGCDCGPCGGVCDDCGHYGATRGVPMVNHSGSSSWTAQGSPTPVMGRRSSADRAITAQGMRAPWEVGGPPRGGWVMNREYVVSQPKVMEDRVVQSHAKPIPAKKTVQANSPTPR
jgi:hypothetical protein